ncbi:MAG TPA: alkaline phosphatase family protein [Acidimicrobiales bacterium]|nr:alkaline phosphatase family protein [Acidimicrobiales bacterium]
MDTSLPPRPVAVTPQPVHPAYGGACLDSLVPALLAPAGQRPEWLPAAARSARQLVLFVLDGLGWDQLATRHHLAPALASMAGGPITSVAPTTTATALTSIALGQPPARHGIVGYRLRVPGPTGEEILNVLRWRTGSGDARAFLPPHEFQPALAFGGRPVPVVTKAEFFATGFSLAHLTGGRHVGWWQPSGIAVEVGRQLRDGEPFVYAYYDGVDKVAHISGFGPYYDAELVAADRLVGDVRAALPAGAVLVVTADHGQVQVGPAVRDVAAEVVAETAMMSGEGRFRWLHAKEGRAGPLAAAARRHHSDEAWVWTTEELIEGGWFGGALTPEIRARLGDVAIVPFEPVAFTDPADTGENRLMCRHGALTAAEVLVPCLAGGPS